MTHAERQGALGKVIEKKGHMDYGPSALKRAESVGFEPTGRFCEGARTVLKTAAINHSATPPKGAHHGPYLFAAKHSQVRAFSLQPQLLRKPPPSVH